MMKLNRIKGAFNGEMENDLNLIVSFERPQYRRDRERKRRTRRRRRKRRRKRRRRKGG